MLVFYDRKSIPWMMMLMRRMIGGRRGLDKGWMIRMDGQQRYFGIQPHPELLVSIEEGYREAITWWKRARQTKLELLTKWTTCNDEETLHRKRCLINSLRRHHFPEVSSTPLEDIVYGRKERIERSGEEGK